MSVRSVGSCNFDVSPRALDLDAVNDALRLRRHYSPFSTLPRTYHRTMFLLLIEQNADIFARVRSWIPDQEYWAMEEAHFMQINELILNYHFDHGRRPKLQDLPQCPPMVVLQESFRLLMEGPKECESMGQRIPSGLLPYARADAHFPARQPSTISSHGAGPVCVPSAYAYGGRNDQDLRPDVQSRPFVVTARLRQQNIKRSGQNRTGVALGKESLNAFWPAGDITPPPDTTPPLQPACIKDARRFPQKEPTPPNDLTRTRVDTPILGPTYYRDQILEEMQQSAAGKASRNRRRRNPPNSTEAPKTPRRMTYKSLRTRADAPLAQIKPLRVTKQEKTGNPPVVQTSARRFSQRIANRLNRSANNAALPSLQFEGIVSGTKCIGNSTRCTDSTNGKAGQ